MKVYIYNDGLVRFATQKYSNNPETLQNRFVHLTNFSINKRAPNFVKNTDKQPSQAVQEDGIASSDDSSDDENKKDGPQIS